MPSVLVIFRKEKTVLLCFIFYQIKTTLSIIQKIFVCYFISKLSQCQTSQALGKSKSLKLIYHQYITFADWIISILYGTVCTYAWGKSINGRWLTYIIELLCNNLELLLKWYANLKIYFFSNRMNTEDN